MTDYYQILGVSPQASTEEIRQQYKKLAVQYHPDRSTDPEAPEKFRQITEAYRNLKDSEQRAQYDEQRSEVPRTRRRFTPRPAWSSVFQPMMCDLQEAFRIFDHLFPTNQTHFQIPPKPSLSTGSSQWDESFFGGNPFQTPFFQQGEMHAYGVTRVSQRDAQGNWITQEEEVRQHNDQRRKKKRRFMTTPKGVTEELDGGVTEKLDGGVTEKLDGGVNLTNLKGDTSAPRKTRSRVPRYRFRS